MGRGRISALQSVTFSNGEGERGWEESIDFCLTKNVTQGAQFFRANSASQKMTFRTFMVLKEQNL